MLRLRLPRMVPRRRLTILSGCLALLLAGTAGAQPRNEPELSGREAVLPVTEPAAIGEWLRRLVGRFRYDGMIQDGPCVDAETGTPRDSCRSVQGNSDCIGIGDGPGVQCVLKVTWPEIIRPGEMEVYQPAYLDPAMDLYGIDPGKSAVNYLVVNHKGLPEGGLGYIRGDTLKIKTNCVNRGVDTDLNQCRRILIIEARRDASIVYVWFGMGQEPSGIVDTYATLTLRHVAENEPQEKTAAGRVQRLGSSRRRGQ